MRALLVGLVMALPMTATAQNPICAPTGEIVAAAVEARKAGQGAEAARAGITEGLEGDKAQFIPAVQPIVDWVYELPQADLEKDVAGSWVTQCEAQ